MPPETVNKGARKALEEPGEIIPFRDLLLGNLPCVVEQSQESPRGRRKVYRRTGAGPGKKQGKRSRNSSTSREIQARFPRVATCERQAKFQFSSLNPE